MAAEQALSAGSATILCCDARNIPLADESVQCVVTSPPYFGLRDYGTAGQIGLEPTPDEYVAQIVAVFREVRRVLRKDGVAWVNLGDSYCSIGHKKSGSGYGTTGLAGGIAQEHFPLRRENAVPGLKHKDRIGIPHRVVFALQADGWWWRDEIVWAKPNPMPESVTDRCTKAHEFIFLLAKSQKYYYDNEAIREAPKPWNDGVMKAPKCGKSRPSYTSLTDASGNVTIKRYAEIKGANKRSVWNVATRPYAGAHFATFPEKLIEPCILAGAPAGGVVLDPFAGAGTTVVVAQRLGRQGIGVELNPAYVALAEERCAKVSAQLSLEAVK